LQQRLKWAGTYAGPVTGKRSRATTVAVRRFQAKFGLPVTGVAARLTWPKLRYLTRNGEGLDRRCRTRGRVVCIDKSLKLVRAVERGVVVRNLDARFGATKSPTRDGRFRVTWKSRDHVSKLYESKMPFSLFFSRGQAVHYSADFNARGYAGASHGCVNLRDWYGAGKLFEWTPAGTRVVVYRS
jgi:hypothetical protein